MAIVSTGRFRTGVGGSGRGFELGPAQNVFTGADRATAEAARDAYATANPSWLASYNSDTNLNIRLEFEENSDAVAEYQVRNDAGDAWVKNESAVGVRGPAGRDGTADLGNLTNGRVPYYDGSVLRNSPMRRMSDGSAFIEGITRIESGTLAVGPFVNLSERGGFLGLRNALGDDFTLLDFRTPRNAASSKPRRLAYTEAENDFVIQAVQTEPLTSPVSFEYVPTLLARTNAFKGIVGTAVTNLRYRIADTATGEVFKYWPSEASWLDNVGQDLSPGEMVLDLEDSSLPLNTNLDLTIDIVYDSGTLLGDTNGVPALTAVLQRGEFKELADMDDVNPDHPVTLRRDMPSAVDSLALVEASLNNNSALWVVANNQLVTSNRSDATIRAQIAGLPDLNGNPIPTVPTQADTIQLRAGTIVRVFGQNDFRVVTAPVVESDIANAQQPTTPQPRITRFVFENQPTSVPAGTTVSGLKTFLIRIDRPDLLTGTLTLKQGDTILSQNIIQPTATSVVANINSFTLASAGLTQTFTLEATPTAGGTISAHITVRVAEPHEFAYWGIRSANDFNIVDVSSLTSVDVTTNNQFSVTGNYDNGDVIGILVPSTHDARTITTFNLPVKDRFTRTANVRTINSVQYILYTLTNSGSIDGQAAYIVGV